MAQRVREEKQAREGGGGSRVSLDAQPQSVWNGTALYVPPVTKPWSCTNIFQRMMTSCPATVWPPPKLIPPVLSAEFMMHGAVHFQSARLVRVVPLFTRWERVISTVT